MDLDKEGLFNSTEIKRYGVHLQSMPLMCLVNRSPGAVFVEVFEVFTPSCMSPWSPKEGHWTHVDFATHFVMTFLKSKHDGVGLINL